MLTRKNSSGRIGVTSFPGRESIAAISDMLTTQQKKAVKLETIGPASFKEILHMGFLLGDSSFIHNRWTQFDLFMFVSHWLSWLLHVYQILRINFALFTTPYEDWFGVIRSVRPFIIIRLIRLVIKFKLPKTRIEQLLKRSSQQVQNVTVFFVFFMALYAIVGVQLFGRMDYHCVLPNTDPNNVTIADLAIPDTMCSPPGGGGYECPGEMVCMRLNLNAKAEGFYGMFNDFGASVFTVYLAASEEGWVYVLYDCMDSLPSHLAFIYFLTLIFFLAWLVKNVFIAVITETFAEIRVQFSEMWQKKDMTFDEEFRQKLEKNEYGWRLIRLDADVNYAGRKQTLQKFLRSMVFQCFVIVFVLLNAIINASFVYRHDQSDKIRKWYYYLIEVGFTTLFNLECLIKILCYGFRNFFRRGIFKFELILCIGSSLNAIKYFYDRNYFTYFQAFRLLRLIKASPILEDFVWKIFSPGKKLGGLVIFTITFVIIASAISLQLFYAVPKLHHFHTFPQAFMSMFQIITQEGWTDFVVEVLRATDDKLVPFVAIYFVAYHLFVTLIVLSLFVAVILDNLEMDEELKKVKQLRAREATTSMRSTLPWRLRVFEKFPTRPQMAAMKRVDSDFPMPKVRDSFAHQFALEGVDTETFDQESDRPKNLLQLAPSRKYCREEPHFRHVGSISLRNSINHLLEISDRTRQSVTNSLNFLPHFYRSSTSLHPRKDALPKSCTVPGKTLHTTMRAKLYNENGDLSRPSDSAPKKELKQGEIDIRALQQKRHLAEVTRYGSLF
ncbi:Voltage-gated calcium channel protein [Trichostrongylus colubriformis]|uniref:Voltage-gated calcium channel protein n=1 Tax=Trichostrongylus colubriformis TaxID=6319 RepID=A0AAN8IDF8_TRICO